MFENKEGYFSTYKELCECISTILLEKKPDYPYPHTLASSLVEMANNNIYFAEHLPSLTDVKIKEGNLEDIKRLLEHFAFSSLSYGY